MPDLTVTDDLKGHFIYDDEEIIQLRQNKLEEVAKKQYPKVGKIKFDSFHFEQLNVKYINEDKVLKLSNNLKNLIDDETNILILKDGNLIYSNLDEQFKDIKIISYFDALKENNQEILAIFHENFQKNDDSKLKLLNSALQNSAILIDIPKNVVIKEALKLHIIGEACDLVHHTIIVGHENSEITIVEKLDNLKPIQVNYVNNIMALENSKINYIGIDRLSEKTNAFIERYGIVKADATLIYALGQLNEGNTLSNNIVKLVGKNAYCESRNVLFTDKENIHAITINIEHLAPYSVGKIINHGIVKDKGVLHVDGIGKINQGMNASNSQQQTHIITLSSDAKVSANPYLLIDEYDVLAGHGAGIGKVDEEELYYLMSRGLKKEKQRN